VRKCVYIFLFFFIHLLGISSYAATQNKTDSIKAVYLNSKDGTKEKGLASIQLADIFRRIDIDSSNFYLSIGKEIAEKLDDDQLRGNILLTKGLLELYQGNYEEVVDNSNQAKKYFKNVNDSIGVAKSIANLGLAYDYWGKYDLATKYYYESLKLMESYEQWEGVVSGGVNVGVVYYIQSKYSKALEFYLEAQNVAQKHHITKYNSLIYNNIALVAEQLGDYDLVIEYYKKAVTHAKEVKNFSAMPTILGNLSLTYQRLEYLDSAMIVLDEAEEHSIKLGNKEALCFVYNRKGGVERASKNYQKALNYLFQAKQIAESIESVVQLEKIYEQITDTYYEMGDYKNAVDYVLLAKTFSDSILNEKNQSQLAELDVQYNTEKKEAEILTLTQAGEIQQMELDKKQYLIWGGALGLLLLLIVIAIIFNSYKQKSRANNEITLQKEIIEEAHKEITDSIAYAKRIQSAILPPAKVVKEYLKESFILYKPKDVVAGDFYWMESVAPTGNKKETNILFAAADCTGHGVPGAMVSVVCNNALNRSVREHRLTEPGKILDKTREIVIQEFEKSDEEVKDGMDIALCSLEGNKLQYAGAHNPLWIIRNGEIIETKADKQPIGKFDNQQSYTTHTIDLQKGDSIYIFSDGYVDQFGGEKGKKFKAKAFRELLLSIQDKPMEDQKLIIDKTFETWKGNLDQIDDVCVIGVRI
jgi:serine phosphatase RsbU (regulator of sigma subunit)